LLPFKSSFESPKIEGSPPSGKILKGQGKGGGKKSRYTPPLKSRGGKREESTLFIPWAKKALLLRLKPTEKKRSAVISCRGKGFSFLPASKKICKRAKGKRKGREHPLQPSVTKEGRGPETKTVKRRKRRTRVYRERQVPY